MKSLTAEQSALLARIIEAEYDNTAGEPDTKRELIMIARKSANHSVTDALSNLAEQLQQSFDLEYPTGDELINEWSQSHDATTRIVLDSEGQRRVA